MNKNEKTKNIFGNEQKGLLNSLTVSSNSYMFMLKQHFKSSSFYLGNLLIPILTVLSLSILLPIYFSFIWMLFIGLGFTAFTTYGTLFFTIKKSTMMKNVNLTLNESLSLYFATFFIILTSTLISLIVIMSSLFFLDIVGVASHEFFFNVYVDNRYLGVKYISWLNIWWGMIIYYWFVQSFLTFSIAFLIENILSTQKNYFIVIFIYMLGGLFFSGIFTSTLYIEEGGVVGVITDSVINDWSENDPAKLQGIIMGYQWGHPMWFISQLWPHYGLNQLAFNSLEAGSYIKDPIEGSVNSEWWKISIEDQITSPETWYYLLMPYFYILLCLWTGGFLNRYKKD